MTRTLARSFAATVTVALACLASQAQAVPIVTGNHSQVGIGAEFVTDFDRFSVTGLNLDLNLGAPTSAAIASYEFVVGGNCYSCTLTPSFEALIPFSVAGVTQQIHLPYAWRSSGPVDTLSFGTVAPLVFQLNPSTLLKVAFDALPELSSGGGSVGGQLVANFSPSAVPEPSTASALMAGLLLLGFVGRRRLSAARPQSTP